MPGADAYAVAIVDDSDLSATGKLAAALDRAGFWTTLRQAQAGRPPDRVRIVILPELRGFGVRSPAATDPELVETLIDQLHDRGFTHVAIVGTTDSSALWAENRDLYALSDLLGYRYVTPGHRPYDIADLAATQLDTVFPADSVLHGCEISRDWRGADIRILFSKNRTDEIAGYSLCLDTLIGVLPLIDKDLHYRKRRHPGDVVAALLGAAPAVFCLIDAIVSAHGACGRRAPISIETQTIIAATDIVLADYTGALKMGLDPRASPIFERVLRTHKLPIRYTVTGSLSPYKNWENVPTPALHAARLCNQAEILDRLVEPWLQRLDPELFPLKHPLDAQLNAALTPFLADAANPTSQWLLLLANALVGWIAQMITSYRTLFDKDDLRRHAVPLGLDLDGVPEEAFATLVEELHSLEPIAAAAAQVSSELAWQYVGEGVVFRYERTLPLDFDVFTQRVDIARTIQFMNDYLGGVVVPLAQDALGRPTRQAERNIYLPQPNYLVLYQGKPIDVSKLEVVEYDNDRHRLYWKTVLSENGSAIRDDGIATFVRTTAGTRITIIGRQQFVLPTFWQVLEPAMTADLKATLVTHAYQTFFERTVANFEALAEGRDIQIGRPVDEPMSPPVEHLVPLLQRFGQIAIPFFRQFVSSNTTETRQDRHVDADGFEHITPSRPVSPQPELDLERITVHMVQFIDGLSQAVRRDLARARRAT